MVNLDTYFKIMNNLKYSQLLKVYIHMGEVMFGYGYFESKVLKYEYPFTQFPCVHIQTCEGVYTT